MVGRELCSSTRSRAVGSETPVANQRPVIGVPNVVLRVGKEHVAQVHAGNKIHIVFPCDHSGKKGNAEFGHVQGRERIELLQFFLELQQHGLKNLRRRQQGLTIDLLALMGVEGGVDPSGTLIREPISFQPI